MTTFVFSQSERKREQLNKVMDHLITLERGQVILYTDIETLTGIKRDSRSWRSFVATLKRQTLSQLNIELWPEKNQGYKLLTIAEQINMSPKSRLSRARRQLNKASQGLAAAGRDTNDVHLTSLASHMKNAIDDARQTLAEQSTRIAQISRAWNK